MIELVQAPANSRVIADGNDTLIMLRANPLGDYYVRAKIYIDGNAVPFLEQSWSKDEDGLCVLNLKHLYLAYFRNPFSSLIETGFRKKDGLLKRVKVVVEEYPVGGAFPTSTLELQEFYILKNHRPQIFDDDLTVAFLDLPQENIKVSREGGFVFPLYLLAGAELSVSVVDELGVAIYSEALINYPTQLTQYELDFSALPVAALNAVFVRFSTSQHQVQKRMEFINESIYPAKQVFYLNNCGFYCTAYLLGRKEMESDLNPKSYAQHNGTEVTYEVEDVKQLRFNSGYGYQEITALIHAIATSLDVRLELQGFWERVKSETKKVQDFVDNQFIYSEALQFSRLNIPNFTNEHAYGHVPELTEIVKTGEENKPIEITKAEFLQAFASTQSATKLRLRDLPVNGGLSYKTTTETISLTDMAANNPSVIPYEIELSNFVAVVYQPDLTEFGSPLDMLTFEMRAEVLWSNIGDLVLNVTDVPDAALPPVININSYQDVGLDANGAGTKQLIADISHPSGDPFTILWQVLNAAPITFSDTSVNNPTLTFTGAVPDTAYQVKVIATNSLNGLEAEKIITLTGSFYSVRATHTTSAPFANSMDGTIFIEGGAPGETATLKRTVQAYDFRQLVIWNINSPSEEILVSSISEITMTFPASGTIEIPVQLHNESSIAVSLEVLIVAVSGGQVIDADNKTFINYINNS